MKKYLFLFSLIFSFSFLHAQQSDSLQIIEKAKDYFKKVYVELNFKDPYSYELLKIKAERVSLREKLEFDIGVYRSAKKSVNMDSTFSFSDFSSAKQKYEALKHTLSKGEKLKEKDYNKYIKKYGEYIELFDSTKKEIEEFRSAHKKLDEDLLLRQEMLDNKSLDFSQTVQWRISLDCYAANSYGNKILGKYIFRMSNDGKLDGEIIKMN
ncbi:hypothetical protein [Sphingobacterium multivorum]|uniref:hypothetical protein n=1 Tax=Sphingobacterium multivorum TaxID=28454 RepID=UPI0028A65F04|nr:hypothetical protein [Sphingobacterium multivorum]